MGFDVESLGLAGSRLETTNVMKPTIDSVIAEQLKQAQIKDPATGREMLERKRDDLLDVFGINAVGEFSLPPVGVRVPLGFSHHGEPVTPPPK